MSFRLHIGVSGGPLRSAQGWRSTCKLDLDVVKRLGLDRGCWVGFELTEVSVELREPSNGGDLRVRHGRTV